METDLWKYILNQKYLIKYDGSNVYIYELISNKKSNLLITFETIEQIRSIQFNHLVPNIIIISFSNGTCKIYNILKKSDKEDILFECMKNEYIKLSIFNIYDPNIIATLTKSNDLYIWDIRKRCYLNIINSKEKINKIKWSLYGCDYLEIRNEDNKIRLINSRTKEEKTKRKVEGKLINFLYLRENILILIKRDKIEKINFENNSIIVEKKFEKLNKSNEDLIQNYNILIVISENCISFFIDIESFEIIKEVTFVGMPISYFYYINGNNEIGLKYINDSELLEECSIKIDNYSDKILKLTKKVDLINIKDNFYDKICSKILKNMCMLNFTENIYDKPNYKKKYMNIEEINKFFSKMKEINIFDRKIFVTQLLDKKDDSQNNNIISELNIENFQIIRNFIELFDEDNTKSRKDAVVKKMKNDLNDKTIIDFFIEIIKLLSFDNTNEKLLEIYLLFLQLYEKYLIMNFGEINIEKYNDEVEYYSVCFSKEDYKDLFNLDKVSEREKILNFLTEANELDNFNYNNSKFTDFIEKFRNEQTKFPDFNQPIEYDCNNNELKWFSIKLHIFIVFKNLKIIEKNEDLLRDIKEGIRVVLTKKLFEDEEIMGNKYKLQSVVFLITNPCSCDNTDLDFFCNLLKSKKNTMNNLIERNYTIIDEKQLEYENVKYDNIEDICLDNLSYKKYKKNEKYNFDYLLNNYVKNKDKIKEFLNNILHKNVFIEAYKILFGDNKYKDRYKKYLEEFVNKRLEFVPIRPYRASALSDKISLNTFISTQKSESHLKHSYKINPKQIKKILITAKYVLNEEHEIFHLINCIPYYENNFSISINTPRKRIYEVENNEEDRDESEGGIYLELLLFNREIHSISLADALFLLNEKNYDKSLCDFLTSFETKNKDDLIINGVFEDFNQLINLDIVTIEELNNYYIEQKSSTILKSVFDSYIVNNLKNDIVGKLRN